MFYIFYQNVSRKNLKLDLLLANIRHSNERLNLLVKKHYRSQLRSAFVGHNLFKRNVILNIEREATRAFAPGHIFCIDVVVANLKSKGILARTNFMSSRFILKLCGGRFESLL